MPVEGLHKDIQCISTTCSIEFSTVLTVGIWKYSKIYWIYSILMVGFKPHAFPVMPVYGSRFKIQAAVTILGDQNANLVEPQ